MLTLQAPTLAPESVERVATSRSWPAEQESVMGQEERKAAPTYPTPVLASLSAPPPWKLLRLRLRAPQPLALLCE